MKSLKHALLVAVILAAGTLSAQAPAWKPFQEFGFLVGSWSGTAEATPRVGGRSARFTMEMGGSYLVLKGSIIFPAQSGVPEESTEEVAYFVYDRDKRKYQCHYFFSSGISGVYDVELPAEGTVRLVSNQFLNYEAGAKSRLTLSRKADNEISFQMELAPAGQDFKTYISSKLNRK